jgi:hypothetical protein
MRSFQKCRTAAWSARDRVALVDGHRAGAITPGVGFLLAGRGYRRRMTDRRRVDEDLTTVDAPFALAHAGLLGGGRGDGFPGLVAVAVDGSPASGSPDR